MKNGTPGIITSEGKLPQLIDPNAHRRFVNNLFRIRHREPKRTPDLVSGRSNFPNNIFRVLHREPNRTPSLVSGIGILVSKVLNSRPIPK